MSTSSQLVTSGKTKWPSIGELFSHPPSEQDTITMLVGRENERVHFTVHRKYLCFFCNDALIALHQHYNAESTYPSFPMIAKAYRNLPEGSPMCRYILDRTLFYADVGRADRLEILEWEKLPQNFLARAALGFRAWVRNGTPKHEVNWFHDQLPSGYLETEDEQDADGRQAKRGNWARITTRGRYTRGLSRLGHLVRAMRIEEDGTMMLVRQNMKPFLTSSTQGGDTPRQKSLRNLSWHRRKEERNWWEL